MYMYIMYTHIRHNRVQMIIYLPVLTLDISLISLWIIFASSQRMYLRILSSLIACRAIEDRLRRPTLLARVLRPDDRVITWERERIPFTKTCN